MMRIGDLAARAGVTARTIRFYEELGIIVPQERTDGGFRLYGDDQYARLQLVLALKGLGFDLDRVRELFQLGVQCRTAGELARALSEHLTVQQREIEDRIAQYEALRCRNQQALVVLRGCHDCGVRREGREGDQCLLYQDHPRVPASIHCEHYRPEATSRRGSRVAVLLRHSDPAAQASAENPHHLSTGE